MKLEKEHVRGPRLSERQSLLIPQSELTPSSVCENDCQKASFASFQHCGDYTHHSTSSFAGLGSIGGSLHVLASTPRNNICE